VAYPFTRSLPSRRLGGRMPQKYADSHTLGWCGHPCETQGRGFPHVVCRHRCLRPVLAGAPSRTTGATAPRATKHATASTRPGAPRRVGVRDG
jgi:hypothetical protein